MGLLSINESQILAFVLVFMRCLGFVLAWPLFSGANVPSPVKVLFSLLLGFVCFSMVEPSTYPNIVQYQTLVGIGIKEVIIGLAMGFLANMIFYAASVCGELISMAMGLTASQIFNPAFGYQTSTVNQLYFFMAAFIYLVINGHHLLIQGLHQSFAIVPLNVMMPRLGSMGGFFMLGGQVLEMGLMLSAPVMVAILLVNFSLGIIGRTVPQINVLITSLPINALLGFAMLGVILPFYVEGIKTGFIDMSDSLFLFLKAF